MRIHFYIKGWSKSDKKTDPITDPKTDSKTDSKTDPKTNPICSGKLVPLEEVLTLLRNAMEARNSTSKGFLIDGYPREVDQAIQFEKNVCKCAFLFFFDVNDKVMVERLLERGKKSGRVDDNEETIKKRLDTFHTHTDPILNYFGDRVVKVNCERDVDSIFTDVCACIDSKCKV